MDQTVSEELRRRVQARTPESTDLLRRFMDQVAPDVVEPDDLDPDVRELRENLRQHFGEARM
jgi:hypothetical protein